MKYIVILGDGMADYPDARLGGRTPLMTAKKPNIDRLAAQGEVGMVRTVPESMKPGSDNANLSVMGYDPLRYYSGRSPLEAVSMGVKLRDGDVTYRCNLVTLSEEQAQYEDRIMADYSSDEITTEEARQLIADLAAEFQGDDIALFAGVSYRHCLRMNGVVPGKVRLTPPHDISDRRIGDFLPAGEGGDRLLGMMKRSYELLKEHPVNRARRARGLRAANSCWFWGEGTKPSLPSFEHKFGLKAAVISAVDLIKGIGICAGMRIVEVEGATGNVNTNFEGKARAAYEALKTGCDFVYVHMEAPDECGHRGEAENKVHAIELIDRKVVGWLTEKLDADGEPYRMLILPDHATPLSLKTHVKDPVPYVLYSSQMPASGGVDHYDEESGKASGIVVDPGYCLMNRFLGRNG